MYCVALSFSKFTSRHKVSLSHTHNTRTHTHVSCFKWVYSLMLTTFTANLQHVGPVGWRLDLPTDVWYSYIKAATALHSIFSWWVVPVHWWERTCGLGWKDPVTGGQLAVWGDRDFGLLGKNQTLGLLSLDCSSCPCSHSQRRITSALQLTLSHGSQPPECLWTLGREHAFTIWQISSTDKVRSGCGGSTGAPWHFVPGVLLPDTNWTSWVTFVWCCKLRVCHQI